MTHEKLIWCLGAALALAGCGGKLLVDRDSPIDGGVVGQSGSADQDATIGGSSGSYQAEGGRAGGSGGSVGTGGLPGTGGVVETDAQRGCATASQCPIPSNPCWRATCSGGLCGIENAPPSVAPQPDLPADCHDTACDGAGNATTTVDQNDVPTPVNPCLEGTCNASGTSGTEPVPSGTACTSATGGVLCDGAGSCVQCLHSGDCPGGMSCAASRTCVAATCTDVDCGGVCPPCDTGKRCSVDADCVTGACDAVSLTCIADRCSDHHQDGLESDADCGGGLCPACALGSACGNDEDCGSTACDAKSLKCISNPCIDHRQDGAESDVDCGDVCPGCPVGRLCNSTSDCQVGHTCTVTVPHVCQ